MKDEEILKEFERFTKKAFFNYLEFDINSPRMKDYYPLWALLTFAYEQRQAERERILELIDEFGDKILNVNTTSKNFIEIPDFEYRLKLLKKEVEK